MLIHDALVLSAVFRRHAHSVLRESTPVSAAIPNIVLKYSSFVVKRRRS